MKRELKPNRLQFTCNKVPEGWTTYADFARSVNHDLKTVSEAVEALGRVPEEGLGYWIVGRQVIRIIRKDMIEPYLTNRSWTRNENELENGNDNEDDNNNFEIDIDSINRSTNLNDAKLKKAKLENIKLALELQRTKNTLISMQSISAIWANMASQIKQNLLGFVPRVSPVLAAEKDTRKCMKILEDEIILILNNLISLEELKEEWDHNNEERK